MTTTEQDAAVRTTLARLQDSPRRPGQTIPAWLDAHQADIITLCQARGIPITADLLGFNNSMIYQWRKSRDLTFATPNLSRDGRRTLTPQNLAPQHLPMPSANGSGPATEQPATEPQLLTPAKTPTDVVLPTLHAYPKAKYIIMENGLVLDIAAGKPVHPEAP